MLISKNTIRNWQKKYIRSIFSVMHDKESFNDVILRSPYYADQKNNYIPDNLYKFYSPTIENIMDFKENRMWLSDPQDFNDLYDCTFSYNLSEFVSKELLKYINETNTNQENCDAGFTLDEIKSLNYPNEVEPYKTLRLGQPNYELFDRVLRKILENKSDYFCKKINIKRYEIRISIEHKLNILRNSKIRVASFSALDRYDDFPKVSQMWAHYASNHSGYCLEFDMRKFKQNISLQNRDYNTPEYIDERLQLSVKAGLFPVAYSSKRVRITYTKLKNLSNLNDNEIQNDKYFSELLYNTYINKSLIWKYEKEYRLILDETLCKYYFNKVPFQYVKTIYLGANMKDHIKNDIIIIAKEKGIEIKLMSLDDHDYELYASNVMYYEWEKDDKRGPCPF